ncbi:hypothetical protein BJP40_26215 [Streptomyces sp. CC53]|uniref:hypothetical protein n=1 Tax=unclassified Streptomyces TaxID=2593676 RepID=UPI0008DE429A|nr:MULTISPECIES: hypothetical protein [unclassified Streptomyces]OII63128.1 hypothetical protein BJP40_26215 [Streptomyces sp. CC53]
MPLHVSQPPAAALNAVLTALGSPAARESGTPALRSVPGPLSADAPLPVHVLSATPAGAAPSTRLVGWRFLIRGGELSLAAADVTPAAEGWVFSHFCEGPYVASTERALRQAEGAQAPWQARLLSVPDLYMLTLWLHGNTEADPSAGSPAPEDLLIPLAPAPPGIAAHRPHRVADLLPRLAVRLVPPPLLGSTA